MKSVGSISAQLAKVLQTLEKIQQDFNSVFEKSRGLSGRMSTRRVDGSLSFDHGAQYFTARDDCFKRYVKSWIHDGLVQPWDGRIVVVEKGVVKDKKADDNRYVAVPGMSSIGKHIASDLSIRLETHVATPKRSDDKWRLATEDGVELGQFDVVVVAVPSHQAAPLLADTRKLADQASRVKMNGCWALMLAFEESLNLGFDGAFVHGSPLSWIACNSSKAGRDGDSETWVAHAAAEWTEGYIDGSPDEIKPLLIEEFWNAVGQTRADPIYSTDLPQKFGRCSSRGNLNGPRKILTNRSTHRPSRQFTVRVQGQQ